MERGDRRARLQGFPSAERGESRAERIKAFCTFDGQTDPVFGKGPCRPGRPSKKCHVFRVARFPMINAGT